MVVYLDELRRAGAYAPARLLGTAHTLADAPAGDDEWIRSLLDQPGGERLTDLRRLLRGLAERTRSGDTRQLLRGPDRRVVAGLATRLTSGQLQVPLLRVAPGQLAATVARQLLFLLKQQARERGATSVAVIDPHPSAPVRDALPADGFGCDDTGAWVVPVVDVCGPWADVLAAARLTLGAANAVADDDWLARPPRVAAARLEHLWWPAKVLDSGLPTFVVPIRPAWAADLFGYSDQLFDRADRLGLLREHAYYRAPRPQPLTAPARLLWYVSGKGSGRVGAVVAYSRLTDVVVDHPAALHRRFAHLGVWRAADVAAAARQGRASALLFEDTELLRRPVPLERLRRLAGDRRLGPLQSPRVIDPDLFSAVYRLGADAS